MTKKIPLICLMGPTASGKTQLAVKLVQQFPFEIISVDSAMVYRGMDIGTAKPEPHILHIAPHHLIDICDPSEAYSAAKFRADALREIQSIFQLGKIPLLVGGTMLYFRALQQGIAVVPSANPEVRSKLLKEAKEQGWPELHKRLQTIDLIAANRIHPHDSQRIQRALEVFELTGKSLTDWQQAGTTEIDEFVMLNLVMGFSDRTILHERIARRFVQMLETGFIDEVKKLRARGDLSVEMPAMRSVGYRQIWEYLDGQYSLEEMREKGIAATRQLAKRQLTWLRSWPDTNYFDSTYEVYNQIVDRITAFLKQQHTVI